MELKDFIEDIKLKLTGGILNLEISDETIGKYVKTAFQEIIRYIDETKLVEVPFARCIDLSNFNYVSVTNVYRTSALGESTSNESMLDPAYAQTWMLFSNDGTMYSLNEYLLNYAAFSTFSQIRNQLSTDLAFKIDKQANKLYINVSSSIPQKIVIEYIPIYKDVSEIHTPYWIDMLQKLALAHTKLALGIIRTRFTQSNALYTQDGETMRTEGLSELKELRDMLTSNDNLFFPVD